MLNKFRDHIELSEKLIACLHFPSHISLVILFSHLYCEYNELWLNEICRNVTMKFNSFTYI